ncbi:MAG TPA: type II secretion system F family protein [Gammaproteobacteria bacterium]|nr:type II secretion system F family protein [Gammaproteobacteria bacterium]
MFELDPQLLRGAALCTGLSVFFSYTLVYRLYGMVAEEDRTYKDPLPRLLRLLWPFIQIIAYFVCSHLPWELIERIERRLQTTGVGYLLNAEQYFALRLISTVIFFVIVYCGMLAFDYWEPTWLAVAPILGFMFPEIWLNDTRKRRETAVIRALPVYLDFITMAVEAGLNLPGALAQAMEKAPPGPMRNEFGIVLRDLRSGLSRAEALRRMGTRLDISEITSFVSAMIQAEKMGASLATVLRVQAEQRRNERFQRAEKMAMEAPIKLVGPLIIFIFPVTFIVLGFPIVMKFLSEGIM